MHHCHRLRPHPAAKHRSVTGNDVPAAEGKNLTSLAGCPQGALGGDKEMVS